MASLLRNIRVGARSLRRTIVRQRTRELGVVAAGLLGVAALASLVAARSSSRIEPAVALRAE